jgi:hypothetical protein
MFLVHNERTKLTANWLNGLAIALIAAGFFGPMAALVYQVAPLTARTGFVIAVAFGCFALAGCLHLFGIVYLRRLHE